MIKTHIFQDKDIKNLSYFFLKTTEVSQNEDMTEMPLDHFMEQADIAINEDASATVTKEDMPLIPVTLSLPLVEPRTSLPSVQQKKTTISMPSSSQVLKYLYSYLTFI